MKKILLSLFLITTSMETIQLSAYCVYNWSNNEPITIKIYKAAENPVTNSKTYGIKATYKLQPRGGKRCRNWKDIDKNNRKKQWAWKAYTQSGSYKLGEGFFPIGGTIVFGGYDENARAKFELNYDGKPWKYHESPWNWPRSIKPWKTYRR